MFHLQLYFFVAFGRPSILLSAFPLPIITIFISLTRRFLATGTFYYVVGDAHGPSRATTHRAVHRVLAAIVRRLTGLIAFPTTPEGCRALQRGFYQMAGLPNVIGK